MRGSTVTIDNSQTRMETHVHMQWRDTCKALFAPS